MIKCSFRPLGTAVAAAAFLSISSGCAHLGLPRSSSMQQLTVAKEQRQFILHVPVSYQRNRPAALVIMLHGHGARAATFERSTGMSTKSDRESFIVVYPQGLGSPSAWHTGTDASGRADVAFIRTLIDSISRQYNVDPRRIYVAGHSNGAFMAYRVGSDLSDRIAAVGISAGSIGRITRTGDTVRVNSPTNPVSLITFAGKADNTVPYDGGLAATGLLRIVPAPGSVTFWASSDGCSNTPDAATLDNGNVVRDTYAGCKDGTGVVLYTITDGTHRWPGDQTPWWQFGLGSHGVSATNEMWAFFAAHPKQGRAEAAKAGR